MKNKITIWTSDGCHHCSVLKGQLKQAGIEFEERDGRKEIQEIIALNPTKKTLPVVTVNGKLEEDHTKLLQLEITNEIE